MPIERWTTSELPAGAFTSGTVQVSSVEVENAFCNAMAKATKQWQRWSAILRAGADTEWVKLAEKVALQATLEVSVAHSAWTRARNTRGEGNAKVQETRETATVQEDQFPLATKAVDAFQSLVRDELVAEKPPAQAKRKNPRTRR